MSGGPPEETKAAEDILRLWRGRKPVQAEPMHVLLVLKHHLLMMIRALFVADDRKARQAHDAPTPPADTPRD